MSGDSPARLHLLRFPPVEVAVDDGEAPPTMRVDPAPDPERRAHRVTRGTPRLAAPGPDRQDVGNEIVGTGCDLVAAPPSAVGTVTTSRSDAALLVVRGASVSSPAQTPAAARTDSSE